MQETAPTRGGEGCKRLYASLLKKTCGKRGWFHRYHFCRINHMAPCRVLIVTFCLLAGAGSLLADALLTITDTPPNGVVGVPYNFRFTATGGTGNYQWSWTGNEDFPGAAVPPGLTLDPNTGQVSGTPTQASTGAQYAIYVQVIDPQDMGFGSATFTIVISLCTPTFANSLTLPVDDAGVPYKPVQLEGQGCASPYTFSQSGSFGGTFNTFPTGMSLLNGLISGTPGPDTVGTYTIGITILEAGGGKSTQTFTLTINPLPTITNSSPLPNGIVGVPYTPLQLTTTGGTQVCPGSNEPPVRFDFSNFPLGLSVSNTGVISGTPTAGGTFAATIGVTDCLNGATRQPFQITITTVSPQLQVSPLSLSFVAQANGDAPATQAVSIVPGASATPPFNFTIAVDGGQANTPAPEWIATKPAANGVAPEQLRVAVNQGTMPAGNSAARIRVIDSNGKENDVAVNLTVNAAQQQLQVTPTALHFSALEQSPGTLTANLLVRNSGGAGPLAFTTTVVGGSSWITGISPSSGQTATNSPVLLQVSVNTTGLAIGSYVDQIQVSSPAGVVNVAVSLFVAGGGPILAVNVTGVRLQAIQNGGFSNAQTVDILNIGDPNSTVNWTAALVNPVPWLALITSSGTATATTPGSLSFNLTSTATQMSPGGYYALIRITDSNSRNSPQYVLVVLDLGAAGAPSLPDPSPAGLFFVTTAGGSTTSSQVVTINTSSVPAVPFQASASTTDGAAWLVVNPSSGSSSGSNPGTVNVSVNPADLTRGVYRGFVNISMSGALRTVNITLIILSSGAQAIPASLSARPFATGCTPSQVVLTETGLVDNFAVPAGWPATLIVQLNDDCGSTLTNGTAVASFSNGDPPLTLSGNGQNGTYSATWQPGTVTSEMVITLNATSGSLTPANVKLFGGVAANQNQPPMLSPGGTVHNENPVLGAPLAPGTVAQVYGTGLGPMPGVLPGVIPLADTFDGTSVLVGPYQAPLYYVSNLQLDVQLPFELTTTQQYPIVVSVNNAISLPDMVSFVPATPGIASANGAAIAQHANFSLITANSPAKPGETIIMYLAGLGPTNPSVPTGMAAPSNPLAKVTNPVTVTVDGQNAKVIFAGLTPGSAGLYQIDFTVPSGAGNGNLNVVVMQNGLVSNTATLPVSQ